MTRTLGIVFLTVLAYSSAHCQNVLDTAKYKDAELFVQKKGYNVQQRLQEIKAIEGKEVTVYEVSGKENNIKATHTGIAEMESSPKFSDEQNSTQILVRTTDADGIKWAYFPLTNDHRYRIYLTEKMK